MQYIYAALLLHELKKEINEENLRKIFQAINEKPDEARIKVLVDSLKGVDIDKAIQAQLQVQPSEVKKEEKKEEKKKEEKKEAVEGLAALFG